MEQTNTIMSGKKQVDDSNVAGASTFVFTTLCRNFCRRWKDIMFDYWTSSCDKDVLIELNSNGKSCLWLVPMSTRVDD